VSICEYALSNIFDRVGSRLSRIGAALLRGEQSRETDHRSTSWKDHRRSEILRDFRDLMYGHTLDLPVKV
jgi:hypothetical protein